MEWVLSDRRFVEWWSCGLVERWNGEVVESSNGAWDGGVVESSIR